ncbi:MAG: helix-turn-helix domain-containing protein [Cyanobacteria bacterium J06635_15]
MTRPQLISKHDPNWLSPGNPDDPRLLHSEPDDRIWVYPSGQGYRQEIPLRDDLTLAIVNYTLHRDVIVEGVDNINCLKFESRLTGVEAGHTFFIPRFRGQSVHIMPARKRTFEVEVIFKQPALVSYFQAYVERLPPQTQTIARRVLQFVYRRGQKGSSLSPSEMLGRILDRKFAINAYHSAEQMLPNALYAEANDLGYAARSVTTPAMQQVTHQILSCPYQNSTRRIYLKRKALSLVSLYLEAMLQSHDDAVDLDCIYQAASILRKQMTQPPTVEALARQVCTNRLKLYQGFHTVYGTTPFGYLRNHRMREAYRLLLTSDLSVGNISAAVGYTNRNRFAMAFRQRIGLNPKALQLQLQKCAS